jgi:phosphonoacetate hydrolase
MQRAGVAVACVTTKDKLRRLLAYGDVPSISVELAHEQALPHLGVHRATDLLGKPNPSIYDPSASIYALELGLALSRSRETCLLYVSLTDYVQHAEGPGGQLADRFYAELDRMWGEFLDAQFRIALVADHGMNPKPNVQYLEDALSAAAVEEFRVLLPITDRYVVHHASLGSAAWVYTPVNEIARASESLLALPGVEEVIPRERAAAELSLPADRIGDLVVLADGETALGKSAAAHDLSALKGPLRSHGGRHEQIVPIIFSHPLSEAGQAQLAAGVSNADVHHLLLNHSA